MSLNKKISLCLVFVLSLIFMTSCTKQALSDVELKNLENNIKSINISAPGPNIRAWIPKDLNVTSSYILSMLKQAKQYDDKLPANNASQTRKSNIGSSQLHLVASDGHIITIRPYHYYDEDGNKQYIANVLTFSKDDTLSISCIMSNDLYDWLKNGKWQTEFTIY